MEVVMHLRHRLFLLFVSLAAGTASAGKAYPEYRLTVVGPAGSTAADINSKGVVVGTYPFSATSTHAFLNRGKGLVNLGALTGTASNAVAINDKGQVLAQWTNSAGQQRGFIYHHGTVRDIGVVANWNTTYTDINNAGYISAYASEPGSFDGPRGFLRAPDGKSVNIGFVPVTAPHTYAYGINNRNQITGASGELSFPEQPLRAIVWTKGAVRDLGDLGWSPNSGMAINDCGQVTGYMSLYEGFHTHVAFIYTHGRILNIDGRPATEQRYSEGAGINNLGYVVGSSNHLSGFLYRGRRMQSLNALIDPKSGWDIENPRAINDAGQIAATAVRKGVRYAVRLDLIRPLLEKAPALDLDAEALVPANDTDLHEGELAQPVKQ
jgi:probable HAF family extracellular repeat protein